MKMSMNEKMLCYGEQTHDDTGLNVQAENCKWQLEDIQCDDIRQSKGEAKNDT